MKKPSKKEITDFIRTEFPHVEFDGIKFVETHEGSCYFKIISFGRMIGQADSPLGDKYWDRVRNHLKWVLG